MIEAKPEQPKVIFDEPKLYLDYFSNFGTNGSGFRTFLKLIEL